MVPPSELTDSSFENGHNINEGSLLRRIDLHLLPAVGILYLMSFLDRSNVGNARIEGLTTSISMTGDQYLTGLTVYFIGYVLFEIPCNIVLKRTTPSFWLPTLSAAWAIVATLLGTVSSYAGFVVARFFLGVTESGLFPGVVYYLSLWYKRRERQYRISLFFSAASLAGAFGGILAYGISFMNGVGGYEGWRWIFIIEGLATFVIAIAAYFFICNYPSTAKFVTEEERSFIQHRLKADSDATNNEGFTWANVMSAIKDPKCWLYGMCFHTCSLPLYTLSLFLPSIITALGYSAANAQLLTIPPYAAATILTFTTAVVSERVNKRAPFIMVSAAIGIIGYIILLANDGTRIEDVSTVVDGKTVVTPTPYVSNPGVSYVGTIFAACGIYPATALVLSWPAINVSGQTKRATANAMQISIGNLGAVIGTQLYRAEDTPLYRVGHSVAMGYLALNIVVVGTLWAVLSRENKQKDQIVAEMRERGEYVEKDYEGDTDVRWRFST